MLLAEQAAADPLSAVLAYGPLGIMVVLFIVGKLRTEGEVRRLEAECARKDAIIGLKDEQLARQQQALAETAIPVMARATQALEQVARHRDRDRDRDREREP